MPKIDDNSKLNALTQILQTTFSMLIAISAGLGFVITSLQIEEAIYNAVIVVLVISFIVCVFWASFVYLENIKIFKIMILAFIAVILCGIVLIYGIGRMAYLTSKL